MRGNSLDLLLAWSRLKHFCIATRANVGVYYDLSLRRGAQVKGYTDNM